MQDRLNAYFDPAAYTQLFKEIRITEKYHAQFRAEFFNVFNTVRLGNPNTTVISNAQGVITSQANAPRQIRSA